MVQATEGSPEFDKEVDRLAAEGLMISRSVLRMRIKNRIIVAVMGKHVNLTHSDFDEFVLEEISHLADESDASANRLEATRKLVRTKGSQAYRGNPAENLDPESLRLRSETDRELARRLRHLRSDEVFRYEVMSQARQDAMDEMFRARMLQDVAIPPEEDDPVERKDRLMELGADLQESLRKYERQALWRERWQRIRDGVRSIFGGQRH